MENNLENMSGVRDTISQSLGLTLTDDKIAKVMEGKSLSLDELLKHHTLTELGVALIRLDSLSKTVADVEKSPDVQKARLVSEVDGKIVLRIGKGEGEKKRFLFDENPQLAASPCDKVAAQLLSEDSETGEIVLSVSEWKKKIIVYRKDQARCSDINKLKNNEVRVCITKEGEGEWCFVVDSGVSSGNSIMRVPTL